MTAAENTHLMHEEMIAYLRDHAPVSSIELAREFLKFKNPDEKIAHVAILGILSKDRRCHFGDDNLWRPVAQAVQTAASTRLADIAWASVYLLVLPENPFRPVHVSVWTISELPELLFERWLEDPDSLPFEEQELLKSVRDTPPDQETRQEKAALLVRACGTRTPVFLSWRQQALFARLAAEADFPPADNAVLAGTLFACCKQPAPRPLTLDSCNKALFGTAAAGGYAYKYGEYFALCCQELFRILYEKGVFLLSDLDAAEQDELSAFDFSGKAFARDDIVNAPQSPGVYGFKTKDSAFLYIGKAINLRRRLMSYFRATDESPDKLSRIRAESHSLVTYRCGSELESLVYEYRLIRRHGPILNTQVAIAERNGVFQPIDDCVVLLPHAEPDKCMSFWFRKNQKVNLRQFFSDFREGAVLEAELEKFFFGSTLLPNPTDFPEQEIATRWVKRHRDELCIILVNRSGSGRELWEIMKSFWKDCINKEREGRGEG
jgi:hypothetical protein